jgi:hypothetical protein
MLGSLIVWRTLTGDNRGVRTLGIVVLLVVLGTLVWNLIP